MKKLLLTLFLALTFIFNPVDGVKADGQYGQGGGNNEQTSYTPSGEYGLSENLLASSAGILFLSGIFYILSKRQEKRLQ